MGEGSSVGLEGNFGKVRAGYFGNFLDDNTGTDASGRHGMINSGSLYGTGKYENFVAYYSPVFSGLQVKAGFSSNVGGQDNNPTAYQGAINSTASYVDANGVTQFVVGTPASTLNTRAYTAAVSYANGPISAGLAYAKYVPQTTFGYTGTDKNASDWNAGVKYDFGVAAVSLFGARQKAGTYTPDVNLASGDVKKFWALGVAAPIGANDTIKAGYGRAKYEWVDGTTAKANAWDIVYLHSLSKRSTVYAMYGNLGGDIKNADDGTYTQAFNVGLRHTF